MCSFINHRVSKNRTVLHFAIFAYILAILVLFLIVFIRFMYKIPKADLTRDPVQLLNGRPYIGMLSNLGIIIWSATAGICLFVNILNLPSNKAEPCPNKRKKIVRMQ